MSENPIGVLMEKDIPQEKPARFHGTAHLEEIGLEAAMTGMCVIREIRVSAETAHKIGLPAGEEFIQVREDSRIGVTPRSIQRLTFSVVRTESGIYAYGLKFESLLI